MAPWLCCTDTHTGVVPINSSKDGFAFVCICKLCYIVRGSFLRGCRDYPVCILTVF
jgi:hypothetical protein